MKDLNPDYPDIDGLIGTVYGEKGDYNSAIKYFEKAVRLNQNDYKSFIGLGACYLNKDDYDKAIQYIKKGLSINPKDTGAHYSLGLAYLNKGDKALALKQYDILKKLDESLADKLLEKIEYKN